MDPYSTASLTADRLADAEPMHMTLMVNKICIDTGQLEALFMHGEPTKDPKATKFAGKITEILNISY